MPQRLWALLAMLTAVSLGVLDGVIVNVALPTIAEALRVSPSESIWIINAYQIAVIVSLLLFAAIGDRIGYRKVYLSGLILFICASVGCANAWDFGSLVACRVVQGLGASGIMCVNTSMIRLIFPSDKLGRGLGINSTVVSVSAVMGPTIAAAILAVAPWEMLFIINMPIGLISILLGIKFLPHNHTLSSGSPLRWSEMALNVTSFGLLFAVVTGITHQLDWWIVAIEAAALLVVGRAYIRSQLTSSIPILPLDMLRIPIFSLSILTSIISFIAQMAALVAMPFYLMSELGYSAVQTGMVMTAWPALNIISAPSAGFLIERIDAKLLGAIGLAILTCGFMLVAAVPANPQPFDFIWRLAICGLGFGLFQSPNNSLIISSAPIERSGSASGMMASARLVGQITGAASVALLLKVLPSGGYVMLFSGVLALVATILSLRRLSA